MDMLVNKTIIVYTQTISERQITKYLNMPNGFVLYEIEIENAKLLTN